MITYETISYGEGRARVRHDQDLPAEATLASQR